MLCPGSAVDVRGLFGDAFLAEGILEKYVWATWHEDLARLLSRNKRPERVLYWDWASSQEKNAKKEAFTRLKAALSTDLPPDCVRQEVLAMSEKIALSSLERFCPPPDQHGLANRIRAWLREPVTEDVTPWIVSGRALLADITI